MTDMQLNEYEKILDEKKHILICILNIVNKSEKNNFQYLKTTLSKDAIVCKIEHLIAKIVRVTKDIKSEKQNKK